MHDGPIVAAGKKIQDTEKALILLHGRGGTAGKILSLGERLRIQDFALFAPQATGNSWYPQSFLAPLARNEPWLSAALKAVGDLAADIEKQGIKKENLYFFGFSQGASLMLEFLARNAMKYGGAVAFTGSLIGDKIYPENYKGNFERMPFFIGAGDSDSHTQAERVHATATILKELGACVTEKLYENMGHTVNQDEIELANRLIFRS
jgi:phospholipase/carboxylesterase